MIKSFCTTITILLFTAAFAQSNFESNTGGGNAFANDINGRPLYLKTEYTADGSPYLYEEYCLADITTMSGKVFTGVKAKINLQEKLLLYKLDNGLEMIMTTPIRRIKFHDHFNEGVTYGERTFQSHLKALNDESAPIYELVYDDSTASLLKLINVTYNDSKRYGEATITRSFRRYDSYFAAIPPSNSELKKVEKNKSSVAALFGNKSTAVSQFISQKKLKCRSDEDLVEVFRYYSSL